MADAGDKNFLFSQHQTLYKNSKFIILKKLKKNSFPGKRKFTEWATSAARFSKSSYQVQGRKKTFFFLIRKTDRRRFSIPESKLQRKKNMEDRNQKKKKSSLGMLTPALPVRRRLIQEACLLLKRIMQQKIFFCPFYLLHKKKFFE